MGFQPVFRKAHLGGIRSLDSVFYRIRMPRARRLEPLELEYAVAYRNIGWTDQYIIDINLNYY